MCLYTVIAAKQDWLFNLLFGKGSIACRNEQTEAASSGVCLISAMNLPLTFQQRTNLSSTTVLIMAIRSF